MVEVTQADRDAAERLWEDCFATTFYHEQTAGSPHIAAIFIEAFARHRIAAMEAGARMMQEAAADWLRGGGFVRDFGIPWREQLADAIRALDPAEVVKGKP